MEEFETKKLADVPVGGVFYLRYRKMIVDKKEGYYVIAKFPGNKGPGMVLYGDDKVKVPV